VVERRHYFGKPFGCDLCLGEVQVFVWRSTAEQKVNYCLGARFTDLLISTKVIELDGKFVFDCTLNEYLKLLRGKICSSQIKTGGVVQTSKFD
jgi:hypothetical protein